MLVGKSDFAGPLVKIDEEQDNSDASESENKEEAK
jgi:hypothetical protein